MERFRIEVGHDHEVQPGNIVGAIANEAGLDAEHIGHIDIRDDHSFVDLPQGMPKDIFNDLKRVWVCNQQLNITRSGDAKRGLGKATRQRSLKGPAEAESPDRKTVKKKVRKKAVKKKRPGKKERASKNK